MKSKTKDREKSRLADGICCWTYVSLSKMPRSDRKIGMDPVLAGRMSLSRFGQGMEWIDLQISIPRKYFISPKSLISNIDFRNSLVALIPSLSLPVIMISSTYTRRATIPEGVVSVKRV